MAANEFSDLYVIDLGSDVRRNPKISGTTHNVFGIQTGVAIGFYVRQKAKLGNIVIHYTRREDAELATDKLAYLRETNLDEISFEDIAPDIKNNWLNRFRLLVGYGHDSIPSATVTTFPVCFCDRRF